MPTINAIAHLNMLTKDVDNDYYLNAQVTGTLYPADIVERLRKREIATKNVDGEAFVQTFLDECAQAASEGYNIVTSFFRSSIGIQGSILSEDLGHPISADRLKVSVNLTQGEGAMAAMKNINIYAFEQAAATGPIIQGICDPTENKNNHLNGGEMVLIQGMRLAIKGDGPTIGVLFMSADDSSKTVLVPATKIFPNTPSKLQFNLPATVTDGKWLVSVTTQGSAAGTLMKEPRTFQYPFTVTVGPIEEGGGDRPEIE